MMANDEARMTNDENMRTTTRAGGHARQVSSYPVRPSSVVRHSFVISLCALAFMVGACTSSRKITKANVDEVAEGMAKKQVESILGPPTTVDTKDFALLKKTVYVYTQGKDTITVVFKDDKVQSKASTLSE